MNLFDLEWWFARTPHQLDVLRTLALVIGTGGVPVLGFLLGWAIKLLRHIRREATAAKQNTESSVWVDGQQHVVPVIDHIEAAAQETRDGFAWVRGTGRYRSMTQDVPRVTMSNYVAGAPDEHPHRHHPRQGEAGVE